MDRGTLVTFLYTSTGRGSFSMASQHSAATRLRFFGSVHLGAAGAEGPTADRKEVTLRKLGLTRTRK